MDIRTPAVALSRGVQFDLTVRATHDTQQFPLARDLSTPDAGTLWHPARLGHCDHLGDVAMRAVRLRAAGSS